MHYTVYHKKFLLTISEQFINSFLIVENPFESPTNHCEPTPRRHSEAMVWPESIAESSPKDHQPTEWPLPDTRECSPDHSSMGVHILRRVCVHGGVATRLRTHPQRQPDVLPVRSQGSTERVRWLLPDQIQQRDQVAKDVWPVECDSDQLQHDGPSIFRCSGWKGWDQDPNRWESQAEPSRAPLRGLSVYAVWRWVYDVIVGWANITLWVLDCNGCFFLSWTSNCNIVCLVYDCCD